MAGQTLTVCILLYHIYIIEVFKGGIELDDIVMFQSCMQLNFPIDLQIQL